MTTSMDTTAMSRKFCCPPARLHKRDSGLRSAPAAPAAPSRGPCERQTKAAAASASHSELQLTPPGHAGPGDDASSDCDRRVPSVARAGLLAQQGAGAPQAAQQRRKGPLEVEASLYALLRRQSPELRRKLLRSCFSETQRLALERWILTSQAAQICSGRRSSSHHKKRSKKAAAGRSDTKGLFGIQRHSRNGRLLYRASVFAGPFRLAAGYCGELREALDDLELLLRIRSRVAESGQKATGVIGGELVAGTARLEELFRRSILEELRADPAAAATQRVWRLRFSAYVSAKPLVGAPALFTPTFAATPSGLEAGLRAWRGLRESLFCACGGGGHPRSVSLAAALPRLCAAYARVWTTTCRRQPKPSRLQAKLLALASSWRGRPLTATVAAGRGWKRSRATACAPSDRPGGSRGFGHARCGLGLGKGSSVDVEKQVLRLLARWARVEQKKVGGFGTSATGKAGDAIAPSRPARQASSSYHVSGRARAALVLATPTSLAPARAAAGSAGPTEPSGREGPAGLAGPAERAGIAGAAGTAGTAAPSGPTGASGPAGLALALAGPAGSVALAPALTAASALAPSMARRAMSGAGASGVWDAHRKRRLSGKMWDGSGGFTG
eukprot:TRINITY_DN30278_c0_g1_i1.p1 TRINITY_DN30278_c0_g1~~TRINITY_DN30278_c0_g1_i1.p1  ORF type:complete len:615 (-),score=86.73 TRINITY_DN30278_c0_g1_i1:7-1851(-)